MLHGILPKLPLSADYDTERDEAVRRGMRSDRFADAAGAHQQRAVQQSRQHARQTH